LSDHIKIIFISILILIVSGCTSPIIRGEAQKLSFCYSDVDEKNSMPFEEREANNGRSLNGVRSVILVSAIVNVIRGRYKENVAIEQVSGLYLDKKIVEMQTYKTCCSEPAAECDVKGDRTECKFI
jgi:hypothetical protein